MKISDGHRIICPNRGRLFLTDVTATSPREILAEPGETAGYAEASADNSQKRNITEPLKSAVQGQVTLADLERSVAVSAKEVGALIRLKKGQSDAALQAVQS